jgi:hypothetical protein
MFLNKSLDLLVFVIPMMFLALVHLCNYLLVPLPCWHWQHMLQHNPIKP